MWSRADCPSAALSSRAVTRGKPLATATSRAVIRVQVTKVFPTRCSSADKRGRSEVCVGKGADRAANSSIPPF